MGNDRDRQIELDSYYMAMAEAAEKRAACLGQKAGAVLVLANRVVSTGYSGTPAGFPVCEDYGCIPCSGPAPVLEGCVCIHAEQYALITAAQFGNRVDEATLYATQSPCLACLKLVLQAGVSRVVYRTLDAIDYPDVLEQQYRDLVLQLTQGDATRFEPLGGTQRQPRRVA